MTQKASSEKIAYLLKKENLPHVFEIVSVAPELVDRCLGHFWWDLCAHLDKGMPPSLAEMEPAFEPTTAEDEGWGETSDDESYDMSWKFARIDLMFPEDTDQECWFCFSIEQERKEAQQPDKKRAAPRLYHGTYNVCLGIRCSEENLAGKKLIKKDVDAIKAELLSLGFDSNDSWVGYKFLLAPPSDHSAEFLKRHYADPAGRDAFFSLVASTFWPLVEKYQEKLRKINRQLKKKA